MSTSRKTSMTYSRSSFDAMETTRRLSDGMTENEKDERRDMTNTGGLLGDDLYRSLRLQHFKNTEKEYTDANNDVSDQHTDSRKDSDTSNDGGFTSSSLGSIAKERSSDENRDNIYSDSNIIVEDGEEEGDKNNNADQRSESDSDLESPDDFNDNTDYAQYESFERMENMDTDENQNDLLRNDTKADQQVNGLDLTNRLIAKSNIITSSDIENSGNQNEDSSQRTTLCHQQTNDKEKSDMSKTEDQKETKFELHSPKESNPDINSDDSYSKIHDNANVLDHIEKLDEVRDIGFGNMEKLQHMDRSDPALRRLFLRPRVSPAETKSVKVDPDIKSMVNEFLKTNVAENFIITRVLRENYALFYAWLASHMQTERNAWAVRLGQALENAEKERKGSLECKDLVVEAATRLRTLVSTVSNSLYGIQEDKHFEKQEMFRKGPSLRHGHVKGVTNMKGGGGARTSVNNSSQGFDRHKNKNTLKSQQDSSDCNEDVSYEDISSMLRQSSFNMIEVCEPSNYESDPGTSKNYLDVRKKLKSHTNSNGASNNNLSKNAGSLNRKNQNCKYSDSDLASTKPNTESMPFGYTINGTVVEYDDDSDWKQVLIDSIDVLVEICDTFLTDRKACLRLISSKSSQYESLVDALSNFIQDNQSRDYFKRKEIEKRLRLLEMENKSMQEEMALMKKTLMNKSEDALNLQTHLNRLEAVVKSQKAETMDKCVGTKLEEMASPRVNLIIGRHGKVSKSKSPNYGGENDHRKSNKKYKIIKSPYATQDPSLVNGTIQSKALINQKLNAKNGYTSDTSESGYDNKTTNKANAVVVEDEPPLGIQRQQSFIEISEEKLEKLKHRAKKLEDSLHDAISSMDTLNRSTPWMDKMRNDSDKPTSIAHIQKVKASGNHYQTAKNIAYWKKSSFEVKSTNPHRQRFVGTISKPAYDAHRRPRDPNPTEMEINLRSENSSLLEGRSIIDPHLDKEHNTVSSLKLISDRSQGFTPRSNASHYDGYHSDDDGRSSTRQQQSRQNDLTSRSETHKVRARRGQVKQIVSKCLRCQKLFSPTDNHKLACCYHTKEKERLEHYDHMGMLVKVIYAWKCCHQPQEADGCSFGKHI